MLRRHRLLRVLLGITVLAFLTAAAPQADAAGKGDSKDKDKDKKEAAAKPKDPGQPWAKATKDAEKVEGLFTIYKKPNEVYFLIQEDQLDMEFLGVFSLAQGIGTNFVLGGLPINDRLLEFKRVGDKVLLVEKNVLFTAPTGSAIEKAKDLSLGHSVLAGLKIESVEPETKALLVDMTDVFVSDLSDAAVFMTQAFNNTPFRFDKSRSTLTSLKNFPKNTEVEALLTYSPGSRRNLNIHTVPDNRYVPLKMHYSLCELPNPPMQPRLADDRVGNFLTVKKDFSRDQQEDFFVRYVNRWRLEKKDPNAEVSEPVKPIVFYLDRTMPDEYRPWVKKGIENWQKAYEAAGFKNAIIAKDAPSEEEDPDWDAEDIRYSTIRWITSSNLSFGAIGPSRMDPRTGEIFDADILFEAGFIQNLRNTYRRYAGPEAVGQMVMPTLPELPAFLGNERLCMAQAGMADGGALMRMSLLMAGSLPPGSPVPDEYLGAALLWVTMHEVGHSLGLRHNFRSSTGTPYDKLHDETWTKRNGLTASVMDYAAPNVAVNGETQGEYYGHGVGTADMWVIRYAYTPSGSTDGAVDRAFARKIADENLQPGHEYSTDEDTYPAGALDPRTNIWDLGNDPLAWAKDRNRYIAGLWRNPEFESRILGDNGEYPVLRRAVNTLMGQYAISLGMAVKYFGGQYNNRVHKGQPNAVDPLQPVSSAKQREALAFLADRAFAADAFAMSPALLNRLAPNRWSHWGIQSNFAPGARLDYNLNDFALAIQNNVLNGVTSPMLLARLREAENRTTNPYTLAEHMSGLTEAIWGEVDGALGAGMQKLEGPNTRRALQRAYVDRLANMIVEPDPRTPDDARALARLQLVRIDARAQRGLGAAGLGDNNRAHFLETRARIKRALEAKRQADKG
jgi:hypothetical protein